METIDLYQLHWWDFDTPIEETLRTLDDAVRRKNIRYAGASSMRAYQFADAWHTSARLGLERFVSMQNHYNLAYREEEREMLPQCREKGISVMPWSLLGRGFLARPHEEFLETARAQYMDRDDRFSTRIENYAANGGTEINERVEELSKEYDVTMAQIALAWLLEKEWVDAPIIGTQASNI